jgi:cyclohexa-1,5-dienecarbonyl-CoA hydratase
VTSTATRCERLSIIYEAPVVLITLNNPPLNIIDIAMMEELASVLNEIQSESSISTIVFNGAAKCFSAGVDVRAHARETVASMLEKFHAVVRALVSMRKVTIAAVHGHCLGGGAELAMVCDFVFTTDDAKWGFPEIQLGCFPPVAATALAALVGPKRAAELILSGRSISGAEAAGIGLAIAAVPDAQLSSVVDQCAAWMAKLSPLALAVTKKAMYAWDAMHFDKGLARAEKIYLEELVETADAQEGIRAFLEKRAPKWTGS